MGVGKSPTKATEPLDFGESRRRTAIGRELEPTPDGGTAEGIVVPASSEAAPNRRVGSPTTGTAERIPY